MVAAVVDVVLLVVVLLLVVVFVRSTKRRSIRHVLLSFWHENFSLSFFSFSRTRCHSNVQSVIRSPPFLFEFFFFSYSLCRRLSSSSFFYPVFLYPESRRWSKVIEMGVFERAVVWKSEMYKFGGTEWIIPSRFLHWWKYDHVVTSCNSGSQEIPFFPYTLYFAADTLLLMLLLCALRMLLFTGKGLGREKRTRSVFVKGSARNTHRYTETPVRRRGCE